jgi:hypothetical protein
MHQHCSICVTFRRQLKELESRIGRLLDIREQPPDSLTQEHDSRKKLDELIKAIAETRALHDRHQRTVHSHDAGDPARPRPLNRTRTL